MYIILFIQILPGIIYNAIERFSNKYKIYNEFFYRSAEKLPTSNKSHMKD